MALIAIMFTAFGTAMGAQLRDMQGFQLIMNFIIMPIFFLSGAMFPLTGLPAAMAWIVQANPLAYGIDALRALLIGDVAVQSRTRFRGHLRRGCRAGRHR